MLSKPSATSQTTASAQPGPAASKPLGSHAAAPSTATVATTAKELRDGTLDHLRNLQRP